ncbi:uncharacterized protein LOC134323555 [Trichomycterus rosablanca]|uniref:uncharacterized protein LOC134323555 n=1 Tax=Trichomycterus rosablanca TaxID=2290929 RepID=UPI002F35F6B6
MDFIKQHISHRPCETTLDMPELDELSETFETEPSPTPPSRAGTPSPTPSRVASPHEDQGEVNLPASASSSRKTLEESTAKGVKRKRRSEADVELQKLVVLKQMAAKVDADSTPDVFTTFGNQVALELRQIQDPAIVTRLKRNIMNMIYDAQEHERSRPSSSHAPYTFQPINPPQQSHPQYVAHQGSEPQSFLQKLQHFDPKESL